MRIKNKKALKRRVYSNIREDRLVNHAYAEIAPRSKKKKKKPPAQVCGIGCLGLPHTIRGRFEMLSASPHGEIGEVELMANMSKEFGISPPLAQLLEALFVPNRQGGVKRAEWFLREFVKHIPEGVLINESHVRAFCHRVGIRIIPAPDYLRGHGIEFQIAWPIRRRAKMATEELFAWFDAGARVSNMPSTKGES